ncbi:MAG: PmeII family type II restriction endonuclease [Gordonibacter sp.]|uniref:PmeII family type II restriction endonuclease n=1 Tax=Gordonibacter sp. TaxID=1968902 RepID=UPI002FC96525
MRERQYYVQSLIEIDEQREIAYRYLSDFAANRTTWYRDPKKTNLAMLLKKDVVMFAARGVATAEEFVIEAFRACESSSEETVIGNTWQAVVAAISSDTLDTGDMMTVRDGALYVCELKSQTNTVNSSSFPQELRELKDKCAAQKRFKRASNQDVLPAFCILKEKKPIDEMRTYRTSERDQANKDIDGFCYRYLAGPAFWQWLTGFDSVEGLVEDPSRIDTGDVASARKECMERLLQEMNDALNQRFLPRSIAGVLRLKRMLHEPKQ